jgi:hypothetical protein
MYLWNVAMYTLGINNDEPEEREGERNNKQLMAIK